MLEEVSQNLVAFLKTYILFKLFIMKGVSQLPNMIKNELWTGQLSGEIPQTIGHTH